MSICYLNGEWLPLAEAQVPVLDRGFIFGDGVYEVIPCFSGMLFRLERHLARLEDSLTAIRISSPLTRKAWIDLLGMVVERNGSGDLSVYLQVTRGVAKRDHVLVEPVAPTIFVMATAVVRKARRAVSAITHDDIRWQWCHIKSTSLLAAVLLRMAAKDADAYEAILIRDGKLTEGAASNAFVVHEGRVLTPPKSHLLLPGVTRDVIVEVMAAHGVPYAEVEISAGMLRGADEVWLTGSVSELLPVTRIDDWRVGGGEIGPLYTRVMDLYEAFRDQQVLAWKLSTPA